MLQRDGRLFHIDFGHILGNFKTKFGIRRELSALLLPSEFVYLIQQGEPGSWDQFRHACETGQLTRIKARLRDRLAHQDIGMPARQVSSP
jgi:phosphatidylinositol-4,5-bisphosphate 3-kinase